MTRVRRTIDLQAMTIWGPRVPPVWRGSYSWGIGKNSLRGPCAARDQYSRYEVPLESWPLRLSQTSPVDFL